MRQVINEINKNKNLEVNLPKYASTLMSLYNRYAYIQFTMNYFNYYEVISESDSGIRSDIKEMLITLNEIVKEVMVSGIAGQDLVGAVATIDQMRNEIIKEMQMLTAYVDIFNIYEYVLNRVEYRFVHSHLLDEHSDEALCKNLMQYIVSDQDNMVINLKITEIIRQLPIRMTKEKFYELVKNGLSIYKGNEKKSLDDFLYMLRTCAMLDVPKDFDKQYSDLYSIYQNLKDADYKNLDKNQYEQLYNKLQYATTFLNGTVDYYVMLAELVNGAYAILLSNPYAIVDVEEKHTCDSVIKAVNASFYQEALDPLDQEVTDMLILLEGRQERLGEQYLQIEFLLDDIKKQHSPLVQSLALDSQYESLYRISALLSGSHFVDFERDDSDGEAASDQYVKQVEAQLRQDLSVIFKENNRMVSRAVMAAVLSELPVFFNNLTELQDYIYQSLNSCTDKAEKMACIEILNSLMEE